MTPFPPLVALPLVLRPSEPALTEGRREVVFIDAGLPDWPSLVAGVPTGKEIVLLDPAADGLAQMAAWAAGKAGYDAIHVLSHGAEGAVRLGTLTLDTAAAETRAADLAALGAALTEAGDLLLYGCSVASGTGEAFIAALAAATGADIAASADVTGGSAAHGDWDLEEEFGTLDAAPLAYGSYAHALLGDQTLTGTSSAESLAGDAGNDSLSGDAGGDSLAGGDGNDTLLGGDGTDRIYGDAGNDSLSGDADNDILNGGDGNDTLYGGDGNDSMYGGAGTDTFLVPSLSHYTNDTISGGAGSDLIRFYSTTSGDTLVLGSEVTDSDGTISIGISGGQSGQTTTAAVNVDASAMTLAGGVTITGSNGDNRITGSGQTDTLTGGAGADTLDGGAGADSLSGASGADDLIGGLGADTISGGTEADTLTGGGGNDMFVDPLGDLIVDFAEGDAILLSTLGSLGLIASHLQYDSGTKTLTVDHDKNGTFGGGTDLSLTFATAPSGTGTFLISTSGTAAVISFGTAPAGPAVTDLNVTIAGASGTGGAFKIGDTVTATWNNSAGGDNNSGVTAVTVDFTQFGGGASVAASNKADTWTASYKIAAGSIDTTARNVSVTAVDGNGSTTTADSSNATVDTTAPTVTDASISISGASGTSGAFKTGDTVTATWNNTAGGDNNADTMAGVTVDFSAFGGGTAVAASNSSGTWTATYTIQTGSVDATNLNVAVTATDNAGNKTTTADTTNATVDNAAPAVSFGKISVSGASGTGGVYKIGDTVSATWDNSASGDNNADIAGVKIDLSGYGGSSAAVATNKAGVWTATHTLVAGTIDSNANITVTATDDAGNSASQLATKVLVDTALPIVTDNYISIAGATGTGGVYKIGDVITATWNNTAGGDNNSDGMGSVAVDFSAFGGGTAVAASNSANSWTATHTVTAGTIDAGTLNVSVTATDNAGNMTTRADSTNASLDNIAPGSPGTLTLTVATNSGSTADAITSHTKLGVTGTAAEAGVLTLYDGGSAVASATLPSAGAWTLSPSGSFSEGDHTLTARLADDVGNTTSSTGLTVTIDTTAPTLAGSNPLDNATGVAVASNLVLTFSEAVQAGSGVISVRRVADDSVAGSWAITDTSHVTFSGSALTLNPSTDLDFATHYYLEVGSGAIRDAAGHDAADIYGSTTLDFTTAASPPPPPASPPASPPPPPTVNQTVDGVTVQQQTTTNTDGSTTQTTTIPVVTETRQEQTGNNSVADIPLVTSGSTNLLTAQVPTGVGLTVSGSGTAKTAGTSLTDLIREIEARTTAGSSDRTALTGGGSGFLADLPSSTPLIVQTIVPTVASGSTAAPAAPLVISAPPVAEGQAQTALVIDTRGLPSGTVIQLENVSFAAVIGAVQVTGGDGSQSVVGDNANQHVVLGADDDTLRGGDGADTMGSRTGDDRIYGDGGDDNVFGGDDADQVFGGTGADTVQGNKGADLVQGNQGNDVVWAGQDNDTARGGQDDDRVHGDLGDDLAYGDYGADLLYGNAGDDTIWGGDGNDIALDGADTIHGGRGNDIVYAQYGADSVSGDLGDDWLQGNKANDTLSGGAGRDTLRGGADDDLLQGGDDGDELWGDTGADTLTGGAGADLFVFRAGDGVDVVSDFSLGDGDRIRLADAGMTWSVASSTGGSTVTLSGGGTILLHGISANDVTAALFTS